MQVLCTWLPHDKCIWSTNYAWTKILDIGRYLSGSWWSEVKSSKISDHVSCKPPWKEKKKNNYGSKVDTRGPWRKNIFFGIRNEIQHLQIFKHSLVNDLIAVGKRKYRDVFVNSDFGSLNSFKYILRLIYLQACRFT